eukprot:6228929-Pyramimonas_sp.AAC.1
MGPEGIWDASAPVDHAASAVVPAVQNRHVGESPRFALEILAPPCQHLLRRLPGELEPNGGAGVVEETPDALGEVVH